MAEYIERGSLMEAFRTFMAERFDKEKCVSAENCKDCERKCVWHRVVAKAPAADVAPVVHGRWIYTRIDANCSHCGFEWFASCQECGVCPDNTNYCPNCGARMDGETDG